jgi:alpha 1,2-mannosyltransferase
MFAWAAWSAAIALAAHVSVVSATSRTGALIYLTDGSPERVGSLFRSLRSLDYHVNSRWHYPVVIFYESGHTDGASPLTESLRGALQGATTSQLIFAPVDLTTEYAQAPGVTGAPRELFEKSLGYRHMCRFFAGMIAHHPALTPFRYYLRLDVDTVLLSALTADSDIFVDMSENGWRYGHGAMQCDWHTVVDGLWNVADAHFSAEHGLPLSVRLQPQFRDDSCLRSERADPGSYNNRIYYNNFEIVDLEFLRSARYQAFFSAVDAAGGFYTKRWGDAPVRTLAVQALLPPAAVHHFGGALYWHQGLFGIDWALLVAGVAAVVGMLCTLSGLCGAPIVGKLLVARALSTPALRAVQVWRSSAAVVMDTVFCISCCTSASLKLPHAGSASANSSSALAEFDDDRQTRKVTSASIVPTRRSGLGNVRGSSSGTHLNASLSPAPLIIIPVAPSAESARPVNLAAAARVGARRFALLAVLLVAALAAVGLLVSRSRLDTLIRGGKSSSAAAAAATCFSDDLRCLLDELADPRRRVVVTAATISNLPLVLNLIVSWRRIGAADTFAASSSGQSDAAREAAAAASRPVGALKLGGARAVDNFLVLACDYASFRALRARGVPVYWDPAPLDDLNSAATGAKLAAAAFDVLSRTSVNSSVDSSSMEAQVQVYLHRILSHGYHVVYTEASAVWLSNPLDEVTWGVEPDWEKQSQKQDVLKQIPVWAVNPILGHSCAQPRLGDVLLPGVGDGVNAIARTDCSGGQWTYDVIGSADDAGGFDLGFSYFRATNRTRSLLRTAIEKHESFDVSFRRSREDASSQVSGHFRVALFDPALVPGACRFAGASTYGVRPVVARASCHTGLLAQVFVLAQHGYWFTGLWDDSLIVALSVIAIAWIVLRMLRLLVRGRIKAVVSKEESQA